jgi:carbamoyl-phosphate synthase large subunit
MTIRVAITGISGDVGRGAHEGLRQNPPGAEPIWLLGLDSGAEPLGVSEIDEFIRLPLVQEAGYVDALLAAMQAHKIDVLLPGIDSEILLLSRARDRLSMSGTTVVLAPSELVEAADDKLLTARFLSARGIRAPQTWDAASPRKMHFPIVAKPRRGHGSRGISILPDQETLQTFLDSQPENYCLQRHVEGPEITVGFLYSVEGAMVDAVAMERTLEEGRTIRAKVVDDPEMLAFMVDFGKKIAGVGAVNAQLRWDAKQGPMVFEVNARLSGSTEMRVAIGFNDPLRLVQHFGRGVPIVPTQPRKAVVHRSRAGIRVEYC